MFLLKNKLVCILGVITLLLISVLSVAAKEGLDPQRKIIKLAVADPYTGSYAMWGRDAREGIELACEMINSEGGIRRGKLKGYKFELSFFDDKGDPKEAANIAQQVVMGDYFAALAHSNSSCALAALPIYDRNNMLMATTLAAAYSITHSGYTHIVKTWPSTSIEGRAIAHIAVKVLGKKKFVEFYENTAYGQQLSTAFHKAAEGLGAEVLKSYNVIVGQDVDFRSYLTVARKLGVDMLISNLAYTESGLVVNQARAIGLDVPIMICTGSDNPRFFELAGQDMGDVYMPGIFSPYSERPMTRKFMKLFGEKYGKEPGCLAAAGFDVPILIRAAIEDGGTTRETLAKYARRIKGVEGATTTIDVDEESGEVIREMYELKADLEKKCFVPIGEIR